MDDKENGYTYAFEKINVKGLDQEDIRLCLYKDMRDCSSMITKKCWYILLILLKWNLLSCLI